MREPQTTVRRICEGRLRRLILVSFIVSLPPLGVTAASANNGVLPYQCKGSYEPGIHWRVDNLHWTGGDLNFHSHMRCKQAPEPDQVIQNFWLARCDEDPRQTDEPQWTIEHGCSWVDHALVTVAPPGAGHWGPEGMHLGHYHPPTGPPPGVTWVYVGCVQKTENKTGYTPNESIQPTPNVITVNGIPIS